VRIGRSAALSDTGHRRVHNEDSFVWEPPLFAIADGIGGAQAGEIASRLAAAALAERRPGSQGEEVLVALVAEANQRIFERSLGDPLVSGMGTTVTALLVDEAAGTIALGHVGDSRAYVFRAGELSQLTDDHSLVGELVRSGRLTPEAAEQHPHRSVITRAVGTEASVEVDVETIRPEPGDLYIICSDGLTDMLQDAVIASAVAEARGEPDAVAAELVAAANRAGGIDNITVIVFEIEEGEPPPVAEPDETTAESIEVPEAAAVDATPDQTAEVRRHGAGSGGRALALAAIVVAVATAALLIWWGLGK
jgi:serine/threonine protein phosphatase PrpC